MWICRFIGIFAVTIEAERFIRVFPEKEVDHAPSENLFLCPMNVTDGVNLTSWPSEEVIINSTLCMDYDELMEFKGRGDFLKCLTEVINVTTHALDRLGVDATIIDGTLLGWQRHDKNHIPWDVDGDLLIMQSHCRKAFSTHATIHHKNMASLLQEYLPDDSRYRVVAVKYGIGSELSPDEWEGCNTSEIRVTHNYHGVSCHADVFQMLQSSDPGSPCGRCPLPVNASPSSTITVCRSSPGDQCGLLDDLLPTRWDHMNGVNVRVPANPEAALKSHFGPTSLRLINMKEIPRNYKYGSYRLVVGQTLHDEIAHKHSPNFDAQHAKPLENSSLTKEDISSKVFAETTAANPVIIVSPKNTSKGSLASPSYNSTVTLREVETTSLLESHQPLKEYSNPFISVSFVACMSFFGIALLYFFVFKRFRSTSIPSSTSTPSSSYRQVRSPPNSV